jgi:hypothetical protein
LSRHYDPPSNAVFALLASLAAQRALFCCRGEALTKIVRLKDDITTFARAGGVDEWRPLPERYSFGQVGIQQHGISAQAAAI